MFDVVGVVVTGALMLLWGILAVRALGASVLALKLTGLLVWGMLTLLFGLVLVFGVLGFTKINTIYDNPAADITVAGTPEQLARGQQLAQLCMGCHSPDNEFPMIGQNFFEAGGPPIGVLYGSNLTPVHINSWSDGELIRAIREGVHQDGRSLVIMPSDVYKYMSDDDAQALVAFLRSQPATEPDTPATQLNIIGAAFVYLTPLQTRQEPVGRVAAPTIGPNAGYGSYLVTLMSCTSCHGPSLEGISATQGSALPPSPNLTQVIPGWTEDEFITFFRTGVTPDGYEVSDVMPWQDVDRFANEDDLKAMFAYLHALTPIEGTTP
jgi:cytochrome c553